MITVSPAAKELLTRLLEEKNTPQSEAARLIFNQDNLTVEIDGPRSGDTAIDHEGRVILLLDEEAADILSDNTLDVMDTPEGPKLAFILRDQDGAD